MLMILYIHIIQYLRERLNKMDAKYFVDILEECHDLLQ